MYCKGANSTSRHSPVNAVCCWCSQLDLGRARSAGKVMAWEPRLCPAFPSFAQSCAVSANRIAASVLLRSSLRLALLTAVRSLHFWASRSQGRTTNAQGIKDCQGAKCDNIEQRPTLPVIVGIRHWAKPSASRRSTSRLRHPRHPRHGAWNSGSTKHF